MYENIMVCNIKLFFVCSNTLFCFDEQMTLKGRQDNKIIKSLPLDQLKPNMYIKLKPKLFVIVFQIQPKN